jgi:subtilisin-like proprotein convertase family protein
MTHGTHVAGIIAARTNNSIGVAGGAGGGPNGNGVRLMPIRWYGTAPWTAAIIAQSYAYAVDNGAKIINSSYNFDNFVNAGVPDPAVQAAFDYADTKGVLVFHSAGNEGTADPPRRVFDHVLHVANTNANDVRAATSNYGKFVDLAAPGAAILSTTTRSEGTVFEYAALSGTSMASPNAAAVAALIWSKNPSWTRDQVAAQLLATTDSIDNANPNFVGQLGTGRVNAYRAVTETIPPPKLGPINGLPPANGSTTRLPQSFTIAAPMRLDPATIIAANFDLRGDGPDGQFDTADDVLIPLTVQPYRIGAGELTLSTDSIGPVDRYQLRVSASVRDPFGRPLDGNGDGIGGDHFDHVFHVVRQIDGFVYEDRDVDGARGASEPPLFARAVYVDVNNNGQLDAAATTYAAVGLPMALPDNQTTTATLTIAGFAGPVTDVDVELSINHVYVGDLIAQLIGPTGVAIELFRRVGGSDDNFIQTVFDDQAVVSINEGAAPFTGSFRPNGSLADFCELDPNGVWTLRVSDVAASFSGTLIDWRLHITTSEPMGYSDIHGLFGVNGVPSGTYHVREATPSQWTGGPQPATGSYTVAVTTSSTWRGDFGQLRGNSIYGRFYNDANYSGTMDAEETPLAGWTAYLDANNNQKWDGTQQVFVSTNVPLAIPDNSFTTSTVSVSGSVGPVTDVNVTVSINHFNVQQLDVFLIGPTGAKVELFTDVGGGGDHFINTTLDDQAAASITAGTAPFTGTYRPEGRLSDFIGHAADGIWTLWVADDTVQVVGTLVSWSIEVATAEPSALSHADGTFVITKVPDGVYTLRPLTPGGFTLTQPAVGRYEINMTAGQALTHRYFGATNAPPPPPPRVASVVVDDGTGQRSLVRSLTIHFDQAVIVADGVDTPIQVNQAGQSIPLTVALEPTEFAATTAVVTFAHTLADGNYLLTIPAPAVRNLAGMSLDGDGDGVAGGNFVTTFHRLFGDANGDRTITAMDFHQFRLALGQGPSIFDFDNDGLTSAADFNAFRWRYGVFLSP